MSWQQLTPTTTTANRDVFHVQRARGMGVVLPPGSYIFEIANPGSAADVVRVFDRTRSKLFLGALTRRTSRPLSKGLDAAIVFSEANPSVPRRINAWYAAGDTSGYEFLY